MILSQFHDRARRGRADFEQAWADTDGPRILAQARRDPKTQTVSLVLDAAICSTALRILMAGAG